MRYIELFEFFHNIRHVKYKKDTLFGHVYPFMVVKNPLFGSTNSIIQHLRNSYDHR